MKLNLAAELKKESHYYEMLQIKEQLAQAPRPLPLMMKRFPLDEFEPIADKEPKVTAHLSAMLQDSAEGTPRRDDYIEDLWKELSSKQKEIQDTMKRLGGLASMTLVDRGDEKEWRVYRYRLEFANAIVLQRIVLNGQSKVVGSGSEAVEWKASAKAPATPVVPVPVVGIGVSLRTEGGNIIIQEIVLDSPAAAQKEVHAGDRIITIAQDKGDVVDVQDMKLAKVADLIRGLAGTTVRLTIVSSGEDESHARVVSFVRAELKTPKY